MKLLDTVTLSSDSFQNLATCYDTIQSHFATVSTSSNIFSKYKDLQNTLTFRDHLFFSTNNLTLMSLELKQSLLNYDTFGLGLHQFILNPKVISQATTPDSYLQLLSL